MHKQVKLEYLRFNWDLLSVFCINLFNSYRIKEKLNYQPVISSRMLSDNFTYSSLNHSKVFKEAEYPKSFVASNSTLTVNQIGGDRNWYYPFFVMSQIGGILYFFKVVIGTLWSVFSEKLLIFDILFSIRKIVSDKLYNKSNNKSRKRKRSLNKVKPQINNEEDKQKTEGNNITNTIFNGILKVI